MIIKKTDTGSIVLKTIVIIIILYVLVLIFGGFPIPRGSRVNNDYYTYYKNIFGIYYISVEDAPVLFNHGRWGYLDNVDEDSFRVLGEGWAKDANQVWYGDKIIRRVDVKSFHINEHGVAVDKNKVFIRNNGNIRPSNSGIDVKTAEYFVYRLGTLQDEWMRDKNSVYHYDKKLDVDRNSFQICNEDWFIDKYFLYITIYNDITHKRDLHRIDSLQSPMEPGCHYFRNGRNIIYDENIIVKDVDVYRFEEIGVGKYLVNDMLFLWGKPFLKDSLDVMNAKFYYYGRIAADGKKVFYDNNLLKDIDAATFKKINDETFEDKEFIYTISKNNYNKEYPFEKKRK